VAAISKNSVAASVAATQGIYYLATGIWTIIGMRSFEAVFALAWAKSLEHPPVRNAG
jgi:hypothetical protein